MKKTTIILMGLLCIGINMHAQQDTLAKFTYLLGGIKTENGVAKFTPIGSCFFVRQDTRLLLVTAKHNITGINTFDKMLSGRVYDTIAFRYFNIDSNKYMVGTLRIRSVKEKLSNKFYYEDGDFAVVPIESKGIDKFLFSIEKFMEDQSSPAPVNGDIICYGFGVDRPETFNLSDRPIYYAGKKELKFTRSETDVPNKKIYYTVQPMSTPGLSGSPVFVRTIVAGDPVIRFNGILFGTNNAYDYAYIINPRLVTEYIAGINRNIQRFGSPWLVSSTDSRVISL